MRKQTLSIVKRAASLFLVLVLSIGVLAVGFTANSAVSADPPQWEPDVAYPPNSSVSYQGYIYNTVAWTTAGQVPFEGQNSWDPWRLVGPCRFPPPFSNEPGTKTVSSVMMVAKVSPGGRDHIGFTDTQYIMSPKDPQVDTLRTPNSLGNAGTQYLEPGRKYLMYLVSAPPWWYNERPNDCALLTINEYGSVRLEPAGFNNMSGLVTADTLNYKITPAYNGFSIEWAADQDVQEIYSADYLGSGGKIYGPGVTDEELAKWAVLDKNRALKYDDGERQGFSVNYVKDLIAGLGEPARASSIPSFKEEMLGYYPNAKIANSPYMKHDTYANSDYFLHDYYCQGVWDTMPAAYGWQQDEYTEPGLIVKELYREYNLSGKSYGLAGGGQNPWVLCDYLERNAGYYDYALNKKVEGTGSGAGWYKGYDEVTEVPYLWYPEEGIFLSYENIPSLTKRCEYVNDEDLAGIIIWELSGDNTAEYPMITTMKNTLDSGKNILGYFTNWSVYNKFHQYQKPEDLPLDMLTHVNYSFFQVGGYYERGIVAPANELNSMDRWADDYTGVDAGERAPNMIPKFGELKQQYPDFKLLISVGGWTRGDGFHDMVSSAENRRVFVDSVKAFLTQYPQFDGIDLDWEYPSKNRVPDFDDPNDLGSPADGGNFDTYTALCRELRAMLNTMPEGRRVLTACIPAAPGNLVDKQNLTAIANECTFVNAMTYDYHGAFDPTIGYNSPLYPSVEQPNVPIAQREWATSNTVDFITQELNVPKSKINIGTPFYSRGWAGVKADADGNPQPLTDPTPIFPSSSAPSPASINVTPKEKTIEVGESFSISATILPANANQNVTWTMNKSDIITVSGGTVVGMKPGTVTVTATTVNGLSDSCVVTVKEPSQNESIPIAVVKVGEDKFYGADGNLRDCGYEIIIEDGKAFIPFRLAGDIFGANVIWVEETQTAIIRYDYFGYEFRFTIGSNVAQAYELSGVRRPEFDMPLGESEIPFIRNGRTYLPARVLANTTRVGGNGPNMYITYKNTPNGDYLVYSYISEPTDAQVDAIIALADEKL